MRKNGDCRFFNRNLPGYLYGEAPVAVRRAMARHAERCAECGRLLREMERTVATLKSFQPAGITPAEMKELRERVRERIGAAEPLAGRPERFWPVFSYRLVPLAAAAVIILVVTLMLAVWPIADRREELTEAAYVAALSETIEREFMEMGELWRELDELEIILGAERGDELEADAGGEPRPV